MATISYLPNAQTPSDLSPVQPGSVTAREIGAILARLRKERHLSQQAVVDALRAYGIEIGRSALARWENGSNQPGAYQLLALGMILQGTDSLSAFGELSLLHNEPPVLFTAQEAVESLSEYFLMHPLTQPRREIRLIDFPYSTNKTSAGYGYELDEDSFETLPLSPRAIPDGADFGVYVTGDSMEPLYHTGDFLFIQKTSVLREGEIGLFTVDGEGFVKRFSLDAATDAEIEEMGMEDWEYSGRRPMIPVLLSCNVDYAPRRILPHQQFIISGRVLDVLKTEEDGEENEDEE
ncbi:MAG: helix-turn-helix domain-containing protein [Clostridia bacterium]|nr:helix-turn-helix domain-containing protein [Clostridia bacterium]MBR1685316.1 helix-turn-helix domain-containing protein [Clostridia bacterium]